MPLYTNWKCNVQSSAGFFFLILDRHSQWCLSTLTLALNYFLTELSVPWIRVTRLNISNILSSDEWAFFKLFLPLLPFLPLLLTVITVSLSFYHSFFFSFLKNRHTKAHLPSKLTGQRGRQCWSITVASTVWGAVNVPGCRGLSQEELRFYVKRNGLSPKPHIGWGSRL